MIVKRCTLLLVLVFCLSILPSYTVKAETQNAVSGERISGKDRYGTSIGISKFGWKGTSDTAILATGKDFPDALCAAPLAKKYNAPILLTDPSTLSTELKDELIKLKVKNIFIVGGTGVVSQKIEDGLTSMGIVTKRLSGKDRYATCIAVAAEVGGNKSAVITTGENFPDALSIASWAAGTQTPILLTDPKSLPESVANYMKDNNITNTYIIGGYGAVSEDVASRLPSYKRIEGKDRYATNLAVLKEFNPQFHYDKIYLATGEDFPDALSGSALASLTNSPVILTSPDPIPSTKEFMDSNKDKLNEAYILGGEGVVSNSAVVGVIPPVVTKIDLVIPQAVGMNKKMKVAANITMLPSNAPKPDLTYSVSDSSIASLESDGTVTGIIPGTVKITAAAGGITNSADLQVKLDKLIVLDPGHGGWSTGAIPVSSTGVKLDQYKESILNMQIIMKIKYRLDAMGANVALTREGDTYLSLEDRAKMANDLKADLFLSIHHDSVANPYSTGTSTYYSTYKPGIDTNDLYVLADGSSPVYGPDGSKLGDLEDNQEYQVAKIENGDIYISLNGGVGKTSLQYVIARDRTPSFISERSDLLARSINQGIVSLGLPTHGIHDNNLAVNTLSNCPSVLVEVGFISNPIEFEMIRQDSFQGKVADKIVQSIIDFYRDENAVPEDSSPVTP